LRGISWLAAKFTVSFSRRTLLHEVSKYSVSRTDMYLAKDQFNKTLIAHYLPFWSRYLWHGSQKQKSHNFCFVNKANLVHNLFSVYSFLVYLSISTCFGQLCAHHQGKQLCLCYDWYLLFCVDDCLVHTRQSSTQNNKNEVSHNHSCFFWWWAHSRPKHIEIDKYTRNEYTENKLCTNLASFTRLYRDAGQQNIKRPNFTSYV
jgi:hypothetical protein